MLESLNFVSPIKNQDTLYEGVVYVGRNEFGFVSIMFFYFDV